uniref:Acetyl-CoA synthetase n=1 Tax=Ignisphaera aggregans TaxID=334771 RepID=A0A7C5YYN3_9CREN
MRSPKEIIRSALKEKRYKLLENEAFELVKYYGIPIPEAILVRSPREAYELADTVGYPIVLKIVSQDIIHKSDVGGVKLGLMSKEEVACGIEEMLKTVSARVPHARITGVLMYRMAPPGLEVIVGGIRDSVFGAAVMFGLGGVFVEVLRDVSFRIAPVNMDDAFEMINEIKSSKILDGYRGQEPVNKYAIAEIIVKMSKLMLENEEVDSIDLNPVIVYSNEAKVVDVRVILSKNALLNDKS